MDGQYVDDLLDEGLPTGEAGEAKGSVSVMGWKWTQDCVTADICNIRTTTEESLYWGLRRYDQVDVMYI